MAKHSPGPWKIGRSHDGRPHVPFTIWSGGESARDPTAFRVCDGERSELGSGDTEEDSANARLIASAPDLLIVAIAAKSVRDAQRRYFKERTNANLIAAKAEERRLDQLLAGVDSLRTIV